VPFSLVRRVHSVAQVLQQDLFVVARYQVLHSFVNPQSGSWIPSLIGRVGNSSLGNLGRNRQVLQIFSQSFILHSYTIRLCPASRWYFCFFLIVRPLVSTPAGRTGYAVPSVGMTTTYEPRGPLTFTLEHKGKSYFSLEAGVSCIQVP